MAAGAVEVNVTTNNSKACAVFDGVDDYVDLNNDPFVDIANITISMWAKFGTAATTDDRLIVGGASNTNKWLIVHKQATGKLIISNSTDGKATAGAYNDNEWHHILCLTDGTNGTIYVDGVDDTDAGATGGSSVGGNAKIGIKEVGNFEFKGCISDVKIWNRHLTADEIAQDYAGGIVSNGLKHRYKLDKDYTDSVGNNDGTNAGSILAIRDDAIAAAIKADRTTANDKYLMVGMPGGQIVSGIIEEA